MIELHGMDKYWKEMFKQVHIRQFILWQPEHKLRLPKVAKVGKI